MSKSIFDGFQHLKIQNSSAMMGGIGGGDTGKTQHIELTQGLSGLDNYPDPVYNDGNKGDWNDGDAC